MAVRHGSRGLITQCAGVPEDTSLVIRSQLYNSDGVTLCRPSDISAVSIKIFEKVSRELVAEFDPAPADVFHDPPLTHPTWPFPDPYNFEFDLNDGLPDGNQRYRVEVHFIAGSYKSVIVAEVPTIDLYRS